MCYASTGEPKHGATLLRSASLSRQSLATWEQQQQLSGLRRGFELHCAGHAAWHLTLNKSRFSGPVHSCMLQESYSNVVDNATGYDGWVAENLPVEK
jgi:hypothetical protein